MVFVYPQFLWALLALAVPVIIHLFNFQRYKKVYFSNVKFLRELQIESRSRSRLREILILACRCLALAFLVLAFAQPRLPLSGANSKSAGGTAVSIYVDNSFSMENVSKQGRLLDVAKLRAAEIVKAHGQSDRFQIITNDFEGRHQRLYTADNALEIIAAIKLSPAVRQLSQVHSRMLSMLRSAPASNKRIFLISDAQRSTFDLDQIRHDTLYPVTLVPLKANRVNNLFPDSVWFSAPIQQKGFRQKLSARIANKGEARIESGSAKLLIDGEQVALASFSVEAGQQALVNFSFEQRKQGFQYGVIQIEDYPVVFDDKLFLAFNSRLSVRVVLINGQTVKDHPLDALFKGDSLFVLTPMSESTIDYSVFGKADVIILNALSDISSGLLSEINKFVKTGGAVAVIPPPAPGPGYQPALGTLGLPQLGAVDTVGLRMAPISAKNEFFAGVFERIDQRMNLPLINQHYPLRAAGNLDFDVLLSLENGDCFLAQGRVEKAKTYLLASPIEQGATNLSRHALFVPLFYKLALAGLGQRPLYYNLQSDAVIQLQAPDKESEQPPHISQVNGDLDFIPELRKNGTQYQLHTQNQPDNPGFFVVRSSGTDMLPLAFNYSRVESDLDHITFEELSSKVADKGWHKFNVLEDSGEPLSANSVSATEGKSLWKLFIILALVAFLAETLLLRWQGSPLNARKTAS